jgi:hypothetical protein
MKLYTEEQVKKAMLEYTSYSSPTMVQVIDTLKPIELPSDEDISIQASNRHYGTNFKHVYASGAKWMKEQILNQKQISSE